VFIASKKGLDLEKEFWKLSTGILEKENSRPREITFLVKRKKSRLLIICSTNPVQTKATKKLFWQFFKFVPLLHNSMYQLEKS
jgi:hypothetical protein